MCAVSFRVIVKWMSLLFAWWSHVVNTGAVAEVFLKLLIKVLWTAAGICWCLTVITCKLS